MLAALIGSGCISDDSNGDFNPFFRYARHPFDASSDQDAVIPFYESRNRTDGSEWTFRPLMAYEHDDNRSRATCDFLPPLGRYTRDPNASKLRLWPLYWYAKTHHFGEGEEVDWVLFPFLWGGHALDGEDYFAFFPLGGRIRDFFTFRTFDFVLWPLFQQVRHQVTVESVSTALLLLVAWTRGGVRDGSWRFLPFYERRLWEGKYRKYAYLWPFFHYQRNRLDTKHPSTLYSFWPLFLHESSEVFYRFGLIGPVLFFGPLIQYQKETPERWEGEPNVGRRAYYLIDFPWPIVRLQKTRDFERHRVWPLYSHYREPGFDSKAFLIPFFWIREEEHEQAVKKDFFFVPFFQHTKKVYKNNGGEDRYVQVWPLFHREANADGSRDFSTLSLLPLRVTSWVAAMDKVLWPFWNLYRYRRDAGGVSRHSALFGLFSVYRDPEEQRISFPIVYSGRFGRDEAWEHSLFFGLFSLGGDREGLNKLRILFIPFLGG